MGVFGINMNEFEGKTPGGAWVPPDPGTQTFEITAISEGVNSKGEHAGERYVTCKCVQQSGDDPGTRVHSVYLGLSDKPGKYGRPIEQTVGYLKAWGRFDLLDSGEDAEIQDLINTVFQADVKIKTGSDGEPKVNLSNIIPISHAGVAASPPPEPEPAPVQVKPAPTPQPATPPTVMRRGR